MEKVDEEGSLSDAVRLIGMSCCYTWNLVKEVEESLGDAVAGTERGGEQGEDGTDRYWALAN